MSPAVLGVVVNLHLLSRSGAARGGKFGFGSLQVERFQLELVFPQGQGLFTLGVAKLGSVSRLARCH